MAVVFSLLALALMSGCENHEKSDDRTPWPETAIVANLTHALAGQSAGPTVIALKDMGFDTVLFDAASAPSSLLGHWLETAESHQLRSLVRIELSEYPPRDNPKVTPADGQTALLSSSHARLLFIQA